jgi:hypothetical protein
LVVEVKAIACELPTRLGLPLSRFQVSDIRTEVIGRGLVAEISGATIWRWLAEDAIRPWAHRSWIFPRDPDFEPKAARVLDLYARQWQGEPLGEDDYVVSADEKTSIQCRCRCRPTLPPAHSQAMRVEHEYERGGALAYLAAWDVHRAKLFGRCEPSTGIAPFGRLVAQVMAASRTPPPSECSGWSTTAAPIGARPRCGAWPPTGPGHPEQLVRILSTPPSTRRG